MMKRINMQDEIVRL
jgi:cGMP-dependent protein kinase